MLKAKTYYNLPENVIFCKNCTLSNQRPASIPEFYHKKDRDGAKYLNINDDQICDPCKLNDIKNKTIDWDQREKELINLLDKFRSTNNSYDCLVPSSGGKDSSYAAHILKYKYGMNPLTVTWSPIIYTDYGYENFKESIDIGGYDNLSFRPNGVVKKKLVKLSIQNLFHPFQAFILGQKNYPPKIASKFDIKLIFYGENEAEYGNPILDTKKSTRTKEFFTSKNLENIYISGIKIKDLINEHNISIKDLMPYLPMEEEEFNKSKSQIHYLGYYLKWTPQEIYYYSNENAGFKARPYRSQGTYSKYISIDDKVDCLHWYSTFIKFGIGRATYETSQEIRNNHITRDEGLALIKKFDGEFPSNYINDILDYINLDKDEFYKLVDEFRSPHLWKLVNNEWRLRHTVNNDGVDD